MAELKQAVATNSFVGTLKEKDLEIKEMNRNGQKINAMTGKLVVQVDEVSAHTLEVFAYETTNAGKANPAFKSLVTVMDQFVSMADGAVSGQVPDVVQVKSGQVSINDFYVGDKLVSTIRHNVSFLHRAPEFTQEDFGATFSMEIVVKAVRPEIVKDEETGRTIIDAYLVMYGSNVAPIELVVEEGEASDFVQSEFEPGQTRLVHGEIVNKAVVSEKIIKGFGKEKVEKTTQYTNELLVTGGELEAYDDDKAYDVDVIKQALQMREEKLEKMKQEAQEKAKQPKSGASFSGKAPNAGASGKAPAFF